MKVKVLTEPFSPGKFSTGAQRAVNGLWKKMAGNPGLNMTQMFAYEV